MFFRILFLILRLVHVVQPSNGAREENFSSSESPSSNDTPSSNSVTFCFQGRQKFELQNCPHGLFFHQPQNIECLYSFGSPIPRFYTDVCSSPFTIPPKYDSDSGQVMIPITTKITLIEQCTSQDSIENDVLEGVDWVDRDICFRECFDDSDHYPELPAPANLSLENSLEEGAPLISNETKQFLVDQTLRLGDHLFQTIYTLDSASLEVMPKLGHIHLVKIFIKTVQILAKACPHPFLHRDFVNRFFNGFLFLLHDFGTEEIEDLRPEESEDILEALNFCEERGPSFRLEGFICRSKAIVQSSVSLSSVEENWSNGSVPNKNKFPLEKYDLFIESAWRAVDAIHGMCFETFRPNINMHHRYVRGMETLFNERMMHRWINPVELENVSDWSLWFLVDMQSTMDNLQACVDAAYADAPFMSKLDRPVDQLPGAETPTKRKRNTETLNFTADFSFPSTEQMKWVQYEKNGGISTMLKSYATCFQTKEEKDETLASQRSSCVESDEDDDR